jgi:hypothetical protein
MWVYILSSRVYSGVYIEQRRDHGRHDEELRPGRIPRLQRR